MNYASSRLTPVKPSASAAVSQNAKALKAEGHDVIDVGLGEPDFDTPAHIIQAAYDAAKSGQTRYPPTGGTADMKNAVVAKLARENNQTYTPDEIIVSNGAKQVLFNAFMATLETGDEVLLCAPYFGQYKDIVLILGGTPTVLPCSAESGFRLTPQMLEAAITPKTRWLLINSPSNPSGAIYTPKELKALGAVIAKHPNLLVMSDEIYEHILFDGQTFTSFTDANPNLRDQTLIVNGVSKAYAMTGWRIGYGAGPVGLINAMVKVQSQICSGACSIAQAAATAALNGPQHDVRMFNKAFEKRRNLIVDRVAETNGLTLDAPGGAFYAYIGCAAYIGAVTPKGDVISDDVAFADYILKDAKVASVPGSAYDLSPFFRISTATSEDVLNEAMDRIAVSVSKLTPKEK
ncbi:pyridoxal phosphate-dependent aminotransferase [Amylibacter sp. SFDW26]|uniref:pyridoxal phosphate-dependent aminotransferase n=1 Tax=Amylibacter sp. SFDW26 TaxID=2652722 RepID=UPI0012615DAC|nr:pyridoxal phosphate-dependent aminotransferase [Amylibacter sp. SFDW26]KAB7615970.1 pyridoxal phosphate-dependent aminotransferase [Amylibacter sp. SFDW26]